MNEMPELFTRRSCQKIGCAKMGEFLPILCYPPPPPYKRDQGNHIEGTLDMPLCREHMQSLTVAKLQGDAGWQKMVHYFAAMRVVCPRREDTYLKFKRL